MRYAGQAHPSLPPCISYSSIAVMSAVHPLFAYTQSFQSGVRHFVLCVCARCRGPCGDEQLPPEVQVLLQPQPADLASTLGPSPTHPDLKTILGAAKQPTQQLGGQHHSIQPLEGRQGSGQAGGQTVRATVVSCLSLLLCLYL